MNNKNAARSYKQYLAENPGTKMTEAQYNQKYLQSQGGAAGGSSPDQSPPIGPQKAPEYAPNQKPQPASRPAPQVFDALVNMVRKPEIKAKMGKDSPQSILNSQGHKVTDFINHLYDNLGKSTSFDDIAHFEDLGLINPDYTKRRLRINDMEGKVPPKYYDRYNIQHVDHYKPKASLKKLILAASILETLSKYAKR